MTNKKRDMMCQFIRGVALAVSGVVASFLFGGGVYHICSMLDGSGAAGMFAVILTLAAIGLIIEGIGIARAAMRGEYRILG